ncbi:hypothetical protein [Corynebacterium freiburgense]|uniref:hypothetical protein n=1 Tax=Corynebacterium freiburgense TaxID=556548 RepID=UPI000426E2CF|nr:hypothetical protein [Corynebacterium freiburgense]WJZ02789.1 hypothetical protein CFREI_07520 [Corynebacterium freiburgense]
MRSPNPLSRVVSWLTQANLPFEIHNDELRVRAQRWHLDYSYDATLDQLKAVCTWEGNPSYWDIDNLITFISTWNFEYLQPIATLETPTPTTVELRGRTTLPNASMLPAPNIEAFAAVAWVVCRQLMFTAERTLPGGNIGLANTNPFLIQPDALRKMGPAS